MKPNSIFPRLSFLTLLLSTPTLALAGLEICNDSTATQSVALGYKKDADWVSEGWYIFEPGQCLTVLTGDLKNRYYYVTATADGWTFDHEDIAFCVSPQAFDITGDTDCQARGYVTNLFRKIDTGKTAKDFRYNIGPYTRPETPAAAPPGTYGEPYSNAGTFQECAIGDGGSYCSFYADGFLIYVYDQPETPAHLMDFMRSLAPGAPISVEGDMTAIYDSSAELIARSVTSRPWTEADSLLDAMQGDWQSLDDPAETLEITGAERVTRYNGDYITAEAISIQDWCEDFPTGARYLALREIETGETACYGIEMPEGDRIELIYVPRGNLLRYRRVQ